MERKRYVLMFADKDTAREMFATTYCKRTALRHARALNADVYAIPYPGTGWDCPTIRAVFDPIKRRTA